MRAALQVLVGFFGFFAALIFGVVAGFKVESVTMGFVVFALCLCLVVVLFNYIGQAGRINMEMWLASVAQCSHKYAFDGTGIGIDVPNSKVHLVSQFDGKQVSKSYLLPDVKEWGYEVPGATRTFGNVGTAVAVGVAAANANAMERAGLWVRVRDVEFPKWFIKFGNNPKMTKKVMLENELERWIEILDQSVNRRTPIKDSQ